MFKEFVPKRRTLRAAQYKDDSTGLFLARLLAKEGLIVEWNATTYSGSEGEFKVLKEPRFSVVIDNGWERVKLDSWLALESDGTLTIYSDKEFNELYTNDLGDTNAVV